MFDIGFFELIIIAIIALLVIGPERLPHAARMAGAWIGKIRRTVLSVKEELEQEVNLHEMKKRVEEQLMKDASLNDLKEAIEQSQELISGESTRKQMEDIAENAGLTELKTELESGLDTLTNETISEADSTQLKEQDHPATNTASPGE
jgi:sec-independent protein translocase protein TatB